MDPEEGLPNSLARCNSRLTISNNDPGGFLGFWLSNSDCIGDFSGDECQTQCDVIIGEACESTPETNVAIEQEIAGTKQDQGLRFEDTAFCGSSTYQFRP